MTPRTRKTLNEWQTDALDVIESAERPDVLVLAPSGAGKTTLLKLAAQRRRENSEVEEVLAGVSELPENVSEWLGLMNGNSLVTIDEGESLEALDVLHLANITKSALVTGYQVVIAGTPDARFLSRLERNCVVVGPDSVPQTRYRKDTTEIPDEYRIDTA